MNNTINLDLRKMMPFKRHTKILETWNNLKEGQTLRIINDHEPKPLHYLFQAEFKGQFEWNYEQKGPKDWVFKIKKIPKQKDKKKEIKELLKKFHSKKAGVKELKKKGRRILKEISPTDLALLEQEMIQEGTTREEMRRLCDVHLELMKDSIKKPKVKLKAGHPVHTLTEEHKIILKFIQKLKRVTNLLKSVKDFSKAKKEIELLKHIAVHLIESERHHQREEEALFPELERYGVTEPPEIMREEHLNLKAKKKLLEKIAKQNTKMPYPDFLNKLIETSGYLVQELPNHIYKEDNILYPMALQVIPEKEWSKIKKKCDTIGYCCFTPKS
ncbi:MAG: DUF438 domain-containing protein [Candidatus Diapherotrites archaeon]